MHRFYVPCEIDSWLIFICSGNTFHFIKFVIFRMRNNENLKPALTALKNRSSTVTMGGKREKQPNTSNTTAAKRPQSMRLVRWYRQDCLTHCNFIKASAYLAWHSPMTWQHLMFKLIYECR